MDTAVFPMARYPSEEERWQPILNMGIILSLSLLYHGFGALSLCNRAAGDKIMAD